MPDTPYSQPAELVVPPTVVDTWHARSEQWQRRSASRFARRADRPLFIGACPRSGTTLLRTLLDNHPDLAMPAETDFLLSIWSHRADFGDMRKAANRRRLAEWVFAQRGHGTVRLRAGKFSVEEAIERVTGARPTLGSALAACYELYADAHGKPRWGDKRPAYARRMAAIFALFPHAQFINVIRDPRGAVASLMRTGWYHERRALAAAVASWELSVNRVDEFAERLRPDQLLDVRYEDLVADPRGTLARICEFAGLRGGDAVERMVTAERRGSFREGWHENVKGPITTAPVANWRRSLAPEDAAFVERATRPSMERFGYLPDPDLPGTTPNSGPHKQLELQRRRRQKWTADFEQIDHEPRRLLFWRGVAARRPAARRR